MFLCLSLTSIERSVRDDGWMDVDSSDTQVHLSRNLVFSVHRTNEDAVYTLT